MGCRRKRPQSELVRVVREPDSGTLVIGRTSPGRGAWLCADQVECFGLADKKGALGRALRVALRPGASEGLRTGLSGCARMEGRS